VKDDGELDRMDKFDIIEPMLEPGEWLSQLVVVQKSNPVKFDLPLT